MRTLYVADLDGTLLDREGLLSEYTIQTIRRMTDADMLFTIATARSLQAANDLIWLLGIRLPSILTNGALIFDTVHRRYLHADSIALSALPAVFRVLDSHQICGFLHTLRDNQISAYYHRFFQDQDKRYHAHRVEAFEGRIHQVDSLYDVARYSGAVYMAACGERDPLYRAQQELERLPGILVELYFDRYNHLYFLDIFPSTATKAEAMLTLQRMTGAEELVAFGDSYTDMQMLLAADRAYVPRNGVAAARNIATKVLDYAYRDSVPHFLSRELGWE